MNKPKLIKSSAYSAILTIVFVVIITVWAELSVPLKEWLKEISGHHWTTKSIFSALLYAIGIVVFYLAVRGNSENNLGKILKTLIFFTIIGVLILALFYTGHHMRII